jgi:hypothetical protein
MPNTPRTPIAARLDTNLSLANDKMLEPNPITPDGNPGLFLGRTDIIIGAGAEQVTKFPLELVVKQ